MECLDQLRSIFSILSMLYTVCMRLILPYCKVIEVLSWVYATKHHHTLLYKSTWACNVVMCRHLLVRYNRIKHPVWLAMQQLRKHVLHSACPDVAAK